MSVEVGDPHTESRLAAWQERLLPLMVRLVIVLTAFFFLASLGQLVYLHKNIQEQPDSALSDWLARLDGLGPQVGRETLELELAARLEGEVIARRYHMTSTLVMGQLWIRYLGFVTGMILAIIGAVFILGKLKEPASDLQAQSGPIGLGLKTASPGIFLAVVGSGLMLATILTKQEAWVSDAPLYLSGHRAESGSPNAPLEDQIADLIARSKGGAGDGGVKQE